MSDLRRAAQQALEALKNTVGYLPVHFDEHFEAIEALKAAFAKPEPAGEEDMKVYADIAARYNPPQYMTVKEMAIIVETVVDAINNNYTRKLEAIAKDLVSRTGVTYVKQRNRRMGLEFE